MQRITIARTFNIIGGRRITLAEWEATARMMLPQFGTWNLVGSKCNGQNYEATFHEMQGGTPSPLIAPPPPPPDFKAAYELEKAANGVMRVRLAAAEKISQSWETNGAARSAHFKNIAAENASLGRIVNDQRKTMDMWTTDWKALRKAMISRPRGMPMLTHVNQLERMLKVHQQVIAGFKGKLMGTDEAAQPEAADAKVSYAKLHSPVFEAVDPSKIGWTVDWAGYDGQRRLKVGRVRGPVASQMRDQVLEHVIRAMRASTLPSLQNAAERIKASCEAEDAKP